ncbi:MAG: exonuclease domain-containing protein [Pseudomonadota bacterium]
MNLNALSLRLRIFLFFVMLAIGSLLIIAGSLWLGQSSATEGATNGYMTAGLAAGFLSIALILMVWRLFDEHLAMAIDHLATELRTHTHADLTSDIDEGSARYLGDLAPAISAIHRELHRTRSDLDSQVQERTDQIRAEGDRLAALLSDIEAGLLLCSPDHQIVFYNDPATRLLADTGRPRLNRSVFDLLREGPIRQSYDRLRASGKPDAHAELLVSSTGGGRSIGAHMRLLRGALEIGKSPGYVLTLRDLTAHLDSHIERERLLAGVISNLQAPAARLQSLLNKQDDDRMHHNEIAKESQILVKEINYVSEAYAASVSKWWPMQEVHAADLVDGMRAFMAGSGPEVKSKPPDLVLRCDGYAMTNLLAILAQQIAASGISEKVVVEFSREPPGATLFLRWNGAPCPPDVLTETLAKNIEDAAITQTGRELLDRHGSDAHSEHAGDGTSHIRLWIAEARDADDPLAPSSISERPLVYDFGLLSQTDHASINDTPLSDLTYVVFDTETTGLEPHKGDEIVQLAAVRIVKGKEVDTETVDVLVNPERPIPAESTKIHGITDEMVKDAKTIREIGAFFHRFCHRAVLVAHNAPFDMAFFHRHASAIGVEFDHPVFDTVLLSAVIYGQNTEHTLDALAERLNVTIPPALRHTALGDAKATAKILLKLLPVLQARQLSTYGAVFAEMERQGRLLSKMKARVGGAK